MSVITYPLNGVTYDATAVETWLCTRSSGVFAGSGHFEAACAGGYNITISPGLAWVNDGDYLGSTNRFTGKSICLTEAETVTLSAAAGAAGRYDRIVLRLDRTTEPWSAYLAVIEGTAAASPVEPGILRSADYYDLGLYTVFRGAGSTGVTAGDITSTLLDEEVCGIMSDAVTPIATETIEQQFTSLLNRYHTAIQATEAGSNCLLATASIELGEIESIFDGEGHSTEHTYLDAEGLEYVHQLLQDEKQLSQLGTVTQNSTDDACSFSADAGFKDVLIRFNGSGLNAVTLRLNGSSAYTLPLLPSIADSSTGWLTLRTMGQFVQATYSISTTSYDGDYPQTRTSVTMLASGTTLTSFRFYGVASGSFTAICWAR